MTFEQKKSTAYYLMAYCCMKQNEYNSMFVDIIDGYSGKKLAKYGAFGFKTY